MKNLKIAIRFRYNYMTNLKQVIRFKENYMENLKIVVFLADLTAIHLISSLILGGSSILEAIYLLIFLLFLYSFMVYDFENLASLKSQFSRTFLSAALLMVLFTLFDWVGIFRFTSHHVWTALSLSAVLSILNYALFAISRYLVKPKKYFIIGKEEEYSKIAEELANDQNLMFGVSGYVNPDLSQLRALMPMSNGVLR